MLAASVHMMQGTPYVYQGEEIGMTNPGYTSIEQYRDVESTNMYDIMVNQQGVSEEDMLAILAQKSRDNSRAPMQWDDSLHAGFTQGTPWLAVAKNYPEINAEQATADKGSVFYFYQRLIELRKELAVITDGDYLDLLPQHKQVFAYQRQTKAQTLVCINNYYGEAVEVELPVDLDMTKARYVLGNYADIDDQAVALSQALRPYETRIFLVEH